MLFWTIVKVAFRSIAANKLRSFLTMLGVIIGVAAVIAMLGLGAGTKEVITATVRAMGANLLVIRPGARMSGGVRGAGADRDLTLEDGQAILREVADVVMVSPEVSDYGQVKYMNKNTRTRILGQAVTFFKARNFEIARGSRFTEQDVERQARVAVLGPKTATDLFGDMDPIGETIKIKGINFRVIGVTKAKGDQGWMNPDDQVIIPYLTAMRQILGRDRLNALYVTVSDKADMAVVQEKVKEVLRRQHRLQVGQPDDFNLMNLQEINESLSLVAGVLTTLLASVAAVSLLVGGIGIMNIMLVTVTERTREIGIRKALGARRIDLMSQFLLEAVTVSLTGGGLGIALGVGAIWTFNYVASKFPNIGFEAKIELWPIVLSFSVSVLVGVFFGWYPARKAARLDPIEALRYE
ncbi:MAG: ABC transporter permease [Candidatus Sumerlaeaceae bacterium]|nr:ABC transporter permease [Candidatus Sumerlaeaceae bacterium]